MPQHSSWSDPQVFVSLLASLIALGIAVVGGYLADRRANTDRKAAAEAARIDRAQDRRDRERDRSLSLMIDLLRVVVSDGWRENQGATVPERSPEGVALALALRDYSMGATYGVYVNEQDDWARDMTLPVMRKRMIDELYAQIAKMREHDLLSPDMFDPPQVTK
jgi:hypothetical protein